MEWRKIDTVPLGKPVDVWVKAKRRCESFRACNMTLMEDGSWFGPRNLYPTDKITHWMPLPEPPKEEVK